MEKLIVIGAGASGLMAAIRAGRNGASVTVLERMEKPGKKLLMTGNGKCNLTNIHMEAPGAFRGKKPEFAKGVLGQFTAKDTLDFFHDLGVMTKEKRGCVYPYTDQASTILEALLLEAGRLGVRLKYKEEVQDICPLPEGGFRVQTATWSYQADKVILAAGTQAASLSGFQDFGFQLSKKLGHRIIPPLPALVPLKTAGNFPGLVSGVRSQAHLTLTVDGKAAASDRGELQWTAYGISGIVVFQLSRFAVRALAEGKSVSVIVDLLPDCTQKEIEEMANRIAPEFLLNGLFAKKMQKALIKSCFGKKPPVWNSAAILKVLSLAKHLELKITGSRGFAYAQVCCGGVSVREINPDTLESRRVPGLYLTGELIDIDGMCGGYNLQWAWSSGYVAGLHASMPKGHVQGEHL